MSQEDIEATKAPLMEHLVELRSRLIKAVLAFGLMFANFTSLAMEPQGHIAGTASSLYGSITTLLSTPER